MDSFLSFWSSNFLSSLASRLLSFVANQFLVRSLDQELFGVWAVRLSLASDTVIFWSRDGVRKAAAKSGSAATYARFASLPPLLGLLIAPVVLIAARAGAAAVPGFGAAALLTVGGALLELIGELWCVPRLSELRGGAVARVTAAAHLLRSVAAVCVARALIAGGSSARALVVGLGACNLLFGAAVVLGFALCCGRPALALPTRAEISALRPFALQTVLQWLFSQGERLVLLASRTGAEVGAYGMAADLCALVARIVFAPIESAAYSAFAKSAQPPRDVLRVCCRAVVYVGLGAAAYGPVLGPPILRRVYGARWAGEGVCAVLAAFCRIMPLMALNGVAEAYPNARLPAKRMERYNLMLTVVNVMYFALMLALGRVGGAAGAVYANGVAMAVRAVMAIRVVFEEIGVTMEIFPEVPALIAMGALSITGNFLGFRVMLATVPMVVALVAAVEREMVKKVFAFFKKDI